VDGALRFWVVVLCGDRINKVILDPPHTSTVR
jgi:hypothetical protein